MSLSGLEGSPVIITSIDISATGAIQRTIARFERDVEIRAAYITVHTALTGHDTNNRTVTIRDKNGNDILTLTFDVASGGASAGVPKALGSLAAAYKFISAGDYIEFETTDTGTGMALDEATIQVDFTIRPE